MWFISMMGKWKYISSKADLPSENFVNSEKMTLSRRVIRQILKIHNLPAACMHASHADFGLGLPDLQQFKQLAALHSVCSFAFSKDQQAKDFFFIYLNMTRQVNGIKRSADFSNFEFFDWDMKDIKDCKIRKWKWQNDLVETLLLCREHNLKFLLTESAAALQKSEWCLRGCPEADSEIFKVGEITSTKKAVGCARGAIRRLWCLELKTVKASGEMARLERANRKLSNRWKKLGKVSIGEWLFQIKASYRMLITPAKKHTFDNSYSPKCKLCGCRFADQKHILSRCGSLRSSRYVWRHDQVLQIIRKAVSRRWQIISSETNAVKRWIPNTIAVETSATKPDLTLLNETAKDSILVRIVDITVVNDDDENFRLAEANKVAKYLVIKEAIEKRARKEQWGREVDVEVIPVAVGVLGVIQTNWYDIMGKLLIPADEADNLAEAASIAAIKASKWVLNQYYKAVDEAQ